MKPNMQKREKRKKEDNPYNPYNQIIKYSMKPNKLSEQNETKHLLQTDNQSINQLLHENIDNCAA